MVMRRWLICLLAGMLCALSCAAAHALETEEKVRLFEYWSEYGESMDASLFRKASFSLSRGKVSIFISREGGSDNYAGSPCMGNLLAEFSRSMAGLDLSRWETPVSEKDYGALKENEKKKHCRWHLFIRYEPRKPGEAGREVRLEGADSGGNAGRIAAEKAFADFFGSRLKILQAECPKHVETMLWSLPANGGAAHYSLTMRDGRARLWRMLDRNKAECHVYPQFMDEIAGMLKGVDKLNGMGRDLQDRKDPAFMELSLSYDTLQSVHARGYAGRAEAEGMRALLSRISAACDALADKAGAVTLRDGALESFRFFQSDSRYGMRPGYALYRRVDRDGPVAVLERENGQDVAEQVIAESDVQALERLLEECGVASWNGFRGNARGVLDGRSFGLEASFAGGRSISAGGYMRFPKNYGGVTERIFSFLDGLIDGGAAVKRKR